MLRIIRPTLFAFLLLIGFAATSRAEVLTFGVVGDEQTDSVYIESDATLEFFDGVGKGLVGQFDFDVDAPAAGATGLLRFDLRTLRTGIDLRDRHMRERHLNTKDYPYCYYQFLTLSGAPDVIKGDTVYFMTGTGAFYIRGVSRPVDCEFRLERISDDGDPPVLSVSATFSIRLDDFKIPRPRAILLNLAEQIDVTVDFIGHPDQASGQIELPIGWESLH